MLFDRLKIPDPLLEASENGRLVVFAGAGVSKASPSNLPGFDGLIEWLEQKSGIPREERRYDTYLGILHDRQCDVHKWCLELLAEKPTRPNAYHELLVGLFPDVRQLRIVTTNFDEHFGTQLATMKLAGRIRRYCAPALPLGREFTGLVHLHGAMAEPEPRTIVLTDRDMGMAYLSDGWARTFVQELFQTFVVLFVGYKHGDPPVEYLARGMSGRARQKRYALTIAEEAPIWAKYDVEAVPYPAGEGDSRHAALESGLREWVSFLRSQPLDIEERVQKLVTAAPEVVPDAVQSAFLRRCLQRQDWTQFFVRHAKGARWVHWLAEQKLLQACFALRPIAAEELDEMRPATRETRECTTLLARWIGREFARDVDGKLLVHALSCGQLGPILGHALGSQLFYDEVDLGAPATQRWILMLAESASHWGSQNLEPLPWLLKKLEWPRDQSLILVLFRLFLRPRFHLERQFDFDPGASEGVKEVTGVEVELPVDAYELQQAWQKFFLQDTEAARRLLMPVLEEAVGAIYHGLRVGGMARTGNDKLVIQRNHIEGRSYPHSPDGLDVLVDWIVEIVRAHANSPMLGLETAERWLRSEVPILHRCALLLLRESTRITGPQVIELLAAGPWFYSEIANSRGELDAALAAAYPRLDGPQKEKLWSLVEAGPSASWAVHEEGREKAATYERDRLVARLAGKFPADAAAIAAAQRLQKRTPGFKLPSGGNADFEMRVSGSRLASPLSVDELLGKTPEANLPFLMGYKGGEWPEDNRRDLLRAVGNAVAKDPTWGVQLLQALEKEKIVSPELVGAAAVRLSFSKLSKEPQLWLLSHYRQRMEEKDFAEHLCHLVYRDQAHGEPSSYDPAVDVAIYELSFSVWTQLVATDGTAAVEEEPEDWMDRALNRPAGWLCGYWLRRLNSLPVPEHVADRKLPRELAVAFTQMAEAESPNARLGLTMLARDLAFVHFRDPEWTSREIIGRMSLVKSAAPARVVWQTHLHYGVLNRALIRALVSVYMENFAELGKLSAKTRQHLNRKVSIFVLEMVSDGLGETWLRAYLGTLDSKGRTDWAHAMALVLGHRDDAQAALIWDRWMKVYWHDRLGGLPWALESDEAGVMVAWSLGVGERFPEAAAMVEKGPLPEEMRGPILYEMNKAKVASRFPLATAKLALCLLKQVRRLRGAEESVVSMIESMPAEAGLLEVLLELVQELARAGYQHAGKVRADVLARFGGKAKGEQP